MGRPKGSKNKDAEETDVCESLTILEQWAEEGVPCKYARFVVAVPPSKDREPVYEFRLESTDKKYIVNSLIYTPNGLIVGSNGEVDIVPLGNIAYVRTI